MSCHDHKFVDNAVFEKGVVLIEEAKAILNGYIRYVAMQKARDTE